MIKDVLLIHLMRAKVTILFLRLCRSFRNTGTAATLTAAGLFLQESQINIGARRNNDDRGRKK